MVKFKCRGASPLDGAHVLRAGERVLAIARDYFLGVGMGEVAPPAAPSSIPKVQ
jgi:hypothetical protein